jgi:hypothetical protein
MANGISQLENRNWRFKNNVTVDDDFIYGRTRQVFIERFKQLPSINASLDVSTNLDFEVLGTNAAAADITFSSTLGGLTVATHGGATDSTIILPHLGSGQTAWTGIKWGTENQVIWECAIRTPSSLSNITIYGGLKLTNTDVTATDNNQAFFKYINGTDTYWNYIYSIGGTDTATASTVTVAASTDYKFRIEIDSSRRAHFYINDTHVGGSTALTNDVDLIPYVGIVSLSGATAKSMTLYYEKISRIFFE